VFALHQWNDLKKEKLKREQQKAAADAAHDDKP
jgi:nucleosome binding factor SPN SPT16 subunit